MLSRRFVTALLVLALLGGFGCGATKRKWDKGTTYGALTGLVVGGGAGVGIANGAFGHERGSEMARGGAIGAASGALIGGLIGHYLFDPPVELPSPIPVPPPMEPASVDPTELEPLEEGEVLAVVREEQLTGFEFDSADLPFGTAADLDRVAGRLAAAQPANIVVEGHTDSVGTAAYNHMLGLRRAQSVADYLIAAGVPASRVLVRSEGYASPIASNETDEGRRENRRVEVRVANGEGATDAALEDETQVVAYVPLSDEAPIADEVPFGDEVPTVADTPAAEDVAPVAVPAAAVDPASSGSAQEVNDGRPADHVIYFDEDSFTVSSVGQAKIEEMAAALKANGNLEVELVGHVAESETVQSLASLRTARVRLELVNRGIDLSRVRARPASGAAESGSLNRRVEVWLR